MVSANMHDCAVAPSETGFRQQFVFLPGKYDLARRGDGDLREPNVKIENEVKKMKS